LPASVLSLLENAVSNIVDIFNFDLNFIFVLEQLQKQLDADKQTAGSKITIINAKLLDVLAEQVSFLFITSILFLFLYE
jgi:hypothetical protein